nr:helix-turn-helix domain-containing protein [Cytophagales bacterium]
MLYLTIPPPVHLAKFVRFFWILESNQPYEHRSVADGGVEMVFHYQGSFDEIKQEGSGPCASSAIQGTSSGYKVYTCQSAFGIVGVYFYPFAIPALFDLPADELANQMPDLYTFLGTAGKELEDKMMTARNNADRITIITAFLEKKLKKVEERDEALHQFIRSIIHSAGQTKFNAVADEFCLSRRQFERRFKVLAGFSPKMYERIIRFQLAADQYNKQTKSLTQIALDLGYYDQSHFSNDFKKFSGYNPKNYFSGQEVGYEWRDA